MAEAKVIPAVEARVHLGEIMKKSFKKGERFIVEKSGIPMIAILSADEYIHLIEEKEDRFKMFDKIRSNVPDASCKDVEHDVNRAIRAIRKKRA